MRQKVREAVEVRTGRRCKVSPRVVAVLEGAILRGGGGLLWG